MQEKYFAYSWHKKSDAALTVSPKRTFYKKFLPALFRYAIFYRL